MSELFAAIFLVFFVLALVYVVKKLLDSGRISDYKKFIIIPVSNKINDVSKIIKAAYWENKFSDEDSSEILIYPTEKPDEELTVQLNEVCGEFDSVKIIDQNELENYIKSNT